MKKHVLSMMLVLLAGTAMAGCTEKEEKTVSQPLEVKKEEEVKPAEPVIEEEPEPVQLTITNPISGQVLKEFFPDELGYGTDNAAYEAAITQWAKEWARGKEGSTGIDQRMIADKVDANGQIIKGKPRVVLDEKELVNRILSASAKGGTVELPVTSRESAYRVEEVPQLGEVVIASYTTYFNSGVAGRTKNVELSAEALNNVIIGNGDIFSFNSTVGPGNEENGYQEAPVAVDGELVMGIGGGVCQTSSTLFNAVDQLGVEYIEKHHHSVTVGYVPKGRDATIAYGALDFRFQNTTGAPLLLRTIVKNGALTVEVRTSPVYSKNL